MEALQDRWRHASRQSLRRSLMITDAGVLLGCGSVLVRPPTNKASLAHDAERALCLLSIAGRQSQPQSALEGLRRALSSWELGDPALAHIHLAFARLPTISTLDDAWRVFLAEELIEQGMTPRALAKEMGFELPMGGLAKYDPEEPRNPAGSGRISGQWAKNPGAPSSALAPVAPSLTETLGAEALEWLGRLAGRLALPAALFGAVFIPSANPGISTSGAVPGHPGMSYHLDRDTGILRLSLDSDPNPEHALVTQLGPDGIYRDVETKVAIARAVGSNAVLIDLDVAPGLAPSGSERAWRNDGDPKLCPAPTEDRAGGRKEFDILYEQYVRAIANPERQPPLAPGLAFALPADTPSGWAYYDDCRDRTGTMIDAKGNYAEMLAQPFLRDVLQSSGWSKQSGKSTVLKSRDIEWYFHDMDAAVLAHSAFATRGYNDRISIHILPFPGGVPKPNPRVAGYPRSIFGNH